MIGAFRSSRQKKCQTPIIVAVILGDPGAVRRVERKGGTKVFKYGQMSPWVPTLTELFPKVRADAGSWLGTKNASYYCAQSANSFSEFFSWVRTRRLLSRHTCPVRSPSLYVQGKLLFSTFLTRNEGTTMSRSRLVWFILQKHTRNNPHVISKYCLTEN